MSDDYDGKVNGEVVLNLADWIERRRDAVGPYADHIIHSVRAHEAELARLRAALSDERAHADAMAEAVEMFATDRNWLQGGPFDPCSPSFTGTSMASAVAKQHRARRQG